MSIDRISVHTLRNREVHRAVLSNGLVVLALENPSADIVAARLFVRGGSRYEPLEKAGVAHLLSAVMLKGTGDLGAQAIAEYVESLGASLGTDATSDYCLVSLKTVSEDFAGILQLASELVRSPSLPESEVALEQRLTLQGLRSMKEQPFMVAQQQLRKSIYQNHPYSLPTVGDEDSVAKLTRDDLQRYHDTYYRPDSIVMSVVGRIAPNEAIALVDQHFGDWQNPTTDNGQLQPSAERHLPKLTPTGEHLYSHQDTQQAIVMLGYLTSSVHSPDYIVLKLLSTYLGNGLSSRLFVELREKQGLAYEVSAFYPTRLDQSQFVTYLGTAPENVPVALAGLQKEIARLREIQLEPEELQAAKNKLLGQYALGKQTNAQLAQIFGWYELLGLGIEFDGFFGEAIAAVTTETVQDIAQRYFQKSYISLVGPDALPDVSE